MTAALELLFQGISTCGPGTPMTRVGHAIHRLARRRGVAVVPELLGHGIGRHLHCAPDVYHVLNNYHEGMWPGAAFTIEPCAARFGPRVVVPAGGLNVHTADGGRTAQFEHTVLITEAGVDVLTLDLNAR